MFFSQLCFYDNKFCFKRKFNRNDEFLSEANEDNNTKLILSTYNIKNDIIKL